MAMVKGLRYNVATKEYEEYEYEMDMPDPAIAEAERRKQEIKQRLAEIDTESIRPLRATVEGSGTEFDANKLTMLDAEATTLRAELASINK